MGLGKEKPVVNWLPLTPVTAANEAELARTLHQLNPRDKGERLTAQASDLQS